MKKKKAYLGRPTPARGFVVHGLRRPGRRIGVTKFFCPMSEVDTDIN
jgi:hypothetical protein